MLSSFRIFFLVKKSPLVVYLTLIIRMQLAQTRLLKLCLTLITTAHVDESHSGTNTNSDISLDTTAFQNIDPLNFASSPQKLQTTTPSSALSPNRLILETEPIMSSTPMQTPLLAIQPTLSTPLLINQQVDTTYPNLQSENSIEIQPKTIPW